ncbi:hypothetical protein TWF718_006336 [Orbilia javanica]|uniref:Uncharacterized protein n=1 Tax=Orbilia javanica TaxID=47235 RepID=A0AAN8RK63_9PEZI
MAPSAFGYTPLGDPEEVNFAISDMDGRNHQSFVKKTKSSEGKLKYVYISVIRSQEQERRLGIGLVAVEKPNSAIEDMMGLIMDGVVFGAKRALQIALPVVGTLIVTAIEIPGIIDFGIAIMEALVELAKATWRSDRDAALEALRKYAKAHISFGIAVANAAISIKGAFSDLGKTVGRLVAKVEPVGGWVKKNLVDPFVTEKLWKIVEELLQMVAQKILQIPDGLEVDPPKSGALVTVTRNPVQVTATARIPPPVRRHRRLITVY